MIGNDWDIVLKSVWESEGFHKFMNKVKDEYKNHTCYPAYENIFNALKCTPYSNVKIVILGQDPYHGEGEAHGLSFSVRDGVKLPPSLKNIYKELYDDLGVPIRTSGDLSSWAKQGVLMLNSTLTVEKDNANSHSNIGWQQFTDDVIRLIDNNKRDVVFILWGNYARSKKALIKNNFIIDSAHPSPFSAYDGFFGSKPFSKSNNYLKSKGLEEIKW